MAHPGLDRSERVFDHASPFAHGAGPQVHPGLEGVDHRFMLPARDLSLDGRRALSLDATACELARSQYRCSVIGPSPQATSPRRPDSEIQLLNEDIYHPDRIILVLIVVKTFGKQCRQLAICPLN